VVNFTFINVVYDLIFFLFYRKSETLLNRCKNTNTVKKLTIAEKKCNYLFLDTNGI